MSNQMSSSKSRWKGALLAAVAGAAVSPMMAHAQSMSVGIYANPLGGTSPNDYTGKSSVYIDPYSTDTLYVYATITGSAPVSASNVYGLDYLYFNVNAAATAGSVAGQGNVSSAALGTNFGGGAFNGGGGVNGAQVGNLSTGLLTTTPSTVLGDGSVMTNMAKPRAFNNFFWNQSSGSGSDVVVSGNTVSFLVETLTYKPNAAVVSPTGTSPSAVGAAQAVAFNVSIPTLSTGYAPANYFANLGSVPTAGNPAGASNTSSGNISAGSTITLTNALPGDVNLDGLVNGTDSAILAGNFNSPTVGWTNGDLTNDGLVNGSDSAILASNFNTQLGGAPAGLGSPTALIGGGASSVPEPASLALLSVAGLFLARRRRSI